MSLSLLSLSGEERGGGGGGGNGAVRFALLFY